MSLACRFAIALALLVLWTGGALAHAGLISADPADGSVVATPPSAIHLVFTEPVAPIAFSLIAVGGVTQALEGVADGSGIAIALPAGLGNGTYLASWHVTSADGHPVGGTVQFSIGAVSGSIVAAGADAVLASMIWAVRAVQYAALFLGTGTLAFGLIAPDAAFVRRAGIGFVIIGLALVPVAVGLQGLDLLGRSIGNLWTAAPWQYGVTSSYAVTQWALGAGFALAGLSQLTRERRLRAVLVLAGALLGALAPTLSGHASTAAPQWLTRPAVFIHMTSLLFWIGALPVLAELLVKRPADAEQALRRFSRFIPIAIVALLGSGIALAAIQLGPPDISWLSAYGILLGCKLALVALLLLVALINRAKLTQPSLAGEVAASRRLRANIAVETVLVLLVFGIVAGWRFTPPPRVLEAIEGAPATAQLVAESGAVARLVATPGHLGPVQVTAQLGNALEPIAAQAVTLHLSLPDLGIGTITTKGVPDSTGAWQINDLVLPAGGHWTAELQARTGDFDLTTFRGSLDIAPLSASTPNADKDNAMLSLKDTKAALTKGAAILGASLLMSGAAGAHEGIIQEGCPVGQLFASGDITVSAAFTRATPPAAQSAGGYFTITNNGAEADTFLGASSEAASTIELHDMTMKDNVMTMTPMPGGIDIPAGGSVSLTTSGMHLMMMGMDSPFKEGACVQLTLQFAKAGDLPVLLNVGGMAANEPPADGHNTNDMPPMAHDMSDMDMSDMDMDGMDMSSAPSN